MERENRLNEHIYLIDNFKMQEFDTATLSMHYLLIIGDRHYSISRPLFLLIDTIKQHHTMGEIARVFSQKISQSLSSTEISNFINEKLVPTGIIKDHPHAIRKRKSYLYLRIGLFSEKILHPVTVVLKTLFNPVIVKILVLLIFISHYYAIVNFWSATSFLSFTEHPYILIITLCLITISVIFHELGHVSACRYYNVSHKEIGFGLYLHIPVFYSNITECWRLYPLQRAVVDIAGIYFQLIFNIFLMIGFLLTGQLVFISVMQWICLQILFTFNPFLRYDGYWLATDLLGIPNLRKKSIGLLKFVIQSSIKREPNNSFFSGIQPFRKYLFFVYAIVSNIFLLLFISFTFTRFPNLLADFTTSAYEMRDSLLYSISWQNILTNIYKFLIQTILLFFISFFGFRLIRRGISILKKSL